MIWLSETQKIIWFIFQWNGENMRESSFCIIYECILQPYPLYWGLLHCCIWKYCSLSWLNLQSKCGPAKALQLFSLFPSTRINSPHLTLHQKVYKEVSRAIQLELSSKTTCNRTSISQMTWVWMSILTPFWTSWCPNNNIRFEHTHLCNLGLKAPFDCIIDNKQEKIELQPWKYQRRPSKPLASASLNI